MNIIQLQMIDKDVDVLWWKNLFSYFAVCGSRFEIRCWKDEEEQIKKASEFGKLIGTDTEWETIICGVISDEMIEYILNEPKPDDNDIYNKMTDFFTLNIKNSDYDFYSSHYGTEVYIRTDSDEYADNFIRIISPVKNKFSILISE